MENKFGYPKPAKSKKKSRKTATINGKTDKEFYLEVWQSRPHFCEECHKNLDIPDYKTEIGDPIPTLFSHRTSKGARQDLRHDPENINLLCPTCHHKWEFGNRRSMKIYSYDSTRPH